MLSESLLCNSHCWSYWHKVTLITLCPMIEMIFSPYFCLALYPTIWISMLVHLFSRTSVWSLFCILVLVFLTLRNICFLLSASYSCCFWVTLCYTFIHITAEQTETKNLYLILEIQQTHWNPKQKKYKLEGVIQSIQPLWSLLSLKIKIEMGQKNISVYSVVDTYCAVYGRDNLTEQNKVDDFTKLCCFANTWPKCELSVN